MPRWHNHVQTDPATNLPKLRARVGMVFLHFELFPHLSITDNLTIAQIKVLGRPKDEANARGLKMLDRVGLLAHKDILHVAGASPEALERGVAAAQQVLNAARVTAAEAALGHWARAEWQRSGSKFAKPPAAVLEAAAAFALAEAAAIDAARAGSPVPAGSWLEATDA